MADIKAIIFDADGVVVSVDEYYASRYARENGIDEEKLVEFFDFEFPQCLVGEADLREVIQPHIASWGIKDSIDQYLKKWFEAESKLNRELVTMIKNLRNDGMPCYLMSNQEKYRAHYMLEVLGFNTLFDHCFFSYEMHSRKPEEKAYRYVVDSLSYLEGIDDPQHVLFIDDVEENIEAASQIGFNAHIYRSINEITPIVKSIR